MSESTATQQKSLIKQIIPVMLCFFVMGFVDLVGTASNYVKQDLGLTDTEANLFPSLVFFWFLIFSFPTGMLMNHIGRKRTVLISIGVTIASLIIPTFGDSYVIMLVSFSLLGIGNAIMQTSLNPLVSNLINPSKLASTLTFGQFVKAIASFLAPILATWGASAAVSVMGLGWRSIFAIYGVIAVFSYLLLATTHIKEEKPDRTAGFSQSLKQLGRPFIILCFIAIMCHVGIDVGTNTTAPKVIMERLTMPLGDALFATVVYFIFRTIGCLTGTFILRIISSKRFFAISSVIILAGLALLLIGQTQTILYVGMALIGFGNSNIFSIVFAQALISSPNEKNEVSGLMIMGLFGGTIFPLAMGFAADAVGQVGAISVMAIGAVYLLYYTLKIKVVNS